MHEVDAPPEESRDTRRTKCLATRDDSYAAGLTRSTCSVVGTGRAPIVDRAHVAVVARPFAFARDVGIRRELTDSSHAGVRTEFGSRRWTRTHLDTLIGAIVIALGIPVPIRIRIRIRLAISAFTLPSECRTAD